MSDFLYESQRGSPTLTLLNVLSVLGVLNVLNVRYVLHVLHGRIVGLLGLVLFIFISPIREFQFMGKILPRTQV